MLTPDTHGPIVQVGEMPIDGGRIALGLADPADRLIVLIACADPSLLQLDAAGVSALRALLDDAAGRMAARVSPSV